MNSNPLASPLDSATSTETGTFSVVPNNLRFSFEDSLKNSSENSPVVVSVEDLDVEASVSTLVVNTDVGSALIFTVVSSTKLSRSSKSFATVVISSTPKTSTGSNCGTVVASMLDSMSFIL